MSTHYATLGVGRDATQDDIKKAFRAIALKCHPDRNPGDATAEANFKRASEAYNVLSDPAARKAYDLELQLARVQAAADSGFPRGGGPATFFHEWFTRGFGAGEQARRAQHPLRTKIIPIVVPMSTLMGGGDVWIQELKISVTVKPGEALPGHKLAVRESDGLQCIAEVHKVSVPDPFQLRGRDIVAELEVPFPLLALGGVVEVPTPWCVAPLRIRLAPGPVGGRVHHEVGAGVPNLDGLAGALLLTFIGVVPAVATSEQAAAVRALGVSFGCDLSSPPPLAEVLRALFPSP